MPTRCTLRGSVGKGGSGLQVASSSSPGSFVPVPGRRGRAPGVGGPARARAKWQGRRMPRACFRTGRASAHVRVKFLGRDGGDSRAPPARVDGCARSWYDDGDRACGSAGRAPHSHCGGRRFESGQVHLLLPARRVSWLIRAPHSCKRSSVPPARARHPHRVVLLGTWARTASRRPTRSSGLRVPRRSRSAARQRDAADLPKHPAGGADRSIVGSPPADHAAAPTVPRALRSAIHPGRGSPRCARTKGAAGACRRIGN